MSTMITPPSRRSFKPEISVSNHEPDSIYTTPKRSRKIVPKVKSNCCNSAWEDCNHLKTDASSNNGTLKKCCALDEEKSVLIESRTSFSEEDFPATITENKNSCKYITVHDDENKSHSQYDQLLSPVSTACQSVDDDSISIDIIRNIKNKEKGKRPYLKFLCPPYFILAAGLIEISMFVWGGDELMNILVYSPYQRYQVWRFLSYMLLHSGGIHLTLNIIIQTLIATPLELEQGSFRCAVVYLGGGLAGSLGASVLQPTLYMVGASAGVYALLISHLANVVLRFSKLRYRIFRIFAVAVMAASDIAFSVAHWWSPGLASPRIGWAAHCAGAGMGVTLGLLVYTGCDEHLWHIKTAKWICFIIIVVALFTSVVCNIFLVNPTV